ncbi:MAG TPA: DUF4244 domain-containing protein [Mycobacteriales bacterium]|jgi:hypothetical protein|nr:DUF4244 domain-containing protein [Mycobacteriales bacterium]
MERPRNVRRRKVRGDDGMVSAEYAVGSVAACGFAGVLVKVLTSPSIQSLLVKAIMKALHFAF